MDDMKYTTDNRIDVDYYVELAHKERSIAITNFFRKLMHKQPKCSALKASFHTKSLAH